MLFAACLRACSAVVVVLKYFLYVAVSPAELVLTQLYELLGSLQLLAQAVYVKLVALHLGDNLFKLSYGLFIFHFFRHSISYNDMFVFFFQCYGCFPPAATPLSFDGLSAACTTDKAEPWAKRVSMTSPSASAEASVTAWPL